jgi:GMP synthase (glutamine-hydrolysing)
MSYPPEKIAFIPDSLQHRGGRAAHTMSMTAIATKRLLLIDAVDWTSDYPANHPLLNVTSWFRRHFDERLVSIRRAGVHEVLDGGMPSDIDAVIMSGSPRDAWAECEFSSRCLAMLHDLRERDIPFLGVCYGHQLLARAFGGKVAPDPRGLELGASEITLSDAGRRSALFEGLPNVFPVLQSHADAVISLPPKATLLARGEHTPIQAFQLDHMFGVQFHPETDPAVLRFIWEPRKSLWREKAGFDLDERLAALEPAPHTATILRNFIGNVV